METRNENLYKHQHWLCVPSFHSLHIPATALPSGVVWFDLTLKKSTHFPRTRPVQRESKMTTKHNKKKSFINHNYFADAVT